MNKDLKWLKTGDLITFQAQILQGGQPTLKTIRGAVKSISGDNIFLDNNYFFDVETQRRMMQPNMKIKNEIKPLVFIKKGRIIDYQSLKEDYYSSKPTSKHEAIELLKEVIQKILIQQLSEGTTSTALYGGGTFNGEMPSYNQEIRTGENKVSDGQVFPEETLRIVAKKNLDDIKKQNNLSQQSTNDIEKKAIEDFCFKYPSLIIYL